jgi:5-hydroxyisourate hydrolase-like protein (transthyretin family)
LSAITEREIAQLVKTNQGRRLCTRLYRRADGTVITQDCPWSFRALKRRAARFAGVVLSALMSAGTAFARNSTSQNSPPAAESQQQQSGIVIQVVDQQGAVVPSAQVILSRKDKDRRALQTQGTTDSDGRLEIHNVPAGDYVVMVTAKYLLPRKQVVTLLPQKVTSVNILMKADPKGDVIIEMGPAGEALMHNDAQVIHTVTEDRLQTSPSIGIRVSSPGLMRQ